MSQAEPSKRPPGTCVPWERERESLPDVQGDEELIRNIHEQTDALGNMYIWQILLSF